MATVSVTAADVRAVMHDPEDVVDFDSGSGFTPTNGAVVAVSGNDEVKAADATASTGLQDAFGVVVAFKANRAGGYRVSALRKGLVDGFSGLTAGAWIYVSPTAGELVDADPSAAGTTPQKVGVAVNATAIYFDFGGGYSFDAVLQAIQPGVANIVIQDPALGIKAASKPTAESTAAVRYIVGGTYGLKAAGDMPDLSGTVTAAEFGIYLWTIDSAGTITQATLATGATRGAITFPAIPADEAIFGALEINPTGTGNFVGATTDLDDATVVPNAVFLDADQLRAGFNPAVPAAW